MKKLQKFVFILSMAGVALMYFSFATFAVREFLKCQDSTWLSVSFLVGVMLATFYPIFLTFFSLSGKINSGDITFGALLRFSLACFLFLAAKHCIGIMFGGPTSFPSQVYNLLFTETITKVICILVIAFLIKYLKFKKLSTT